MKTYEPSPREHAIEQIEAYIRSNNLKAYDKLPTEREMCQLWNVNRNTLRSALKRLITQGKLCSLWGSGIRIAPRITRTLQDLQGFSEFTVSRGMKPSSRLLSFSRTQCDVKMAERFGMTTGAPLYRVTRLRLMDGTPVLLESSYIDAELTPDLEEHDLVNESLFDLLDEVYDIRISHGRERISVTAATLEEAEHLGIEEGDPAFWMVTETFNSEGRLVEYCRTVGRADMMDLSSTLFWKEA